MTTRREWINPLDFLERYKGITDASQWITVDPNVTPQYRIIRQQVHDGCVDFTADLVMQALWPLVLRESYYAPDGVPEVLPHYVVGMVRLAVAYGTVDLPVGRYPGQRERLTLPVRVVEPKPVTAMYYRVKGEPGLIHHATLTPR